MRFSLFDFWFSSLTRQLILAFLIVSLIPLGLLAFLNERETRAMLTNDANQSLAAAAEQTAAGIDAFILDNREAVRREALLPTFVRYLRLPVEERGGSPEEEAVIATLKELKRRDKAFISTYALLDTEGQNVIDTTPENMGRDESGYDYWSKPLETGLPYLSAPRFVGPSQSQNQAAKWNEAVLYFSAPVRDGYETIGILRMSYQVTILQHLVVKNNGLAGEGSFGILFDEHQVRLAHGTAPDLIFKSVVPLEQEEVQRLQATGHLPNWPLAELSTNLPTLAEGLSNLLVQAEFTTQLVPTGDWLNLATGQKLQTQEWTVLFMQPQDVFLAPIEAQTQATLLLAIAIGGAVVATAFVITRLLAQPIVQLTETVSQFTAGNLEARTEIRRADELGQLAETFNAMAEQLKEAFATLQASEQKYRAIFEHSNDLIYLSTLDGKILDVNPIVEPLLGYSRETFLTLNAEEIYANPDDGLRFQEEIQKHGAIKEFEVQLLRQDGTKIDCLITASLRRAEAYAESFGRSHGTPVGYQGIIRDISQRKQTEKLLQEYNRTLEAEVSARTAQLAKATREAEEARTEAEAANRAKSTFLANMSHELRTPLNAILGFSQILRRSRSLPPDELENVGIISRSGEHLLTLINNVLDLSKIEAGKTTLNPQNFDLHRLLDDLEEMFQLKADHKHLKLIVERTPNVPRYVRTDVVKLRQVLINLLNNAIKFTDAGGLSLRVEVAKEARKAEGAKDKQASEALKLAFEVSDTGAGIAPDELDTLFQAFVQSRSGQKVQEGTGLGLPISNQFVKLMGAQITVQSQVGVGTTFSFEIEVTQAEVSDSYQRQNTRRVITLAPNQPHYRILIVDDKWSNRQLLIKLLNPLGFSLKEACNGQEAVQLWQEWEPHLIWMDMRMPVMDGYEATKRIKSASNGQAPTIIALTASTFEEERAIVLQAGCDDFLRKPFREADIFDLMHQHIGVRYIYDEPSKENAPLVHEEALTAQALATLPTQLLAQLHEAAYGSDIEMMEQTLAQLSHQHPALATQLATLADNFEYDEILELIEEARGR